MKKLTPFVLVGLAGTLATGLVFLAQAGPLNPPGGAVSSTYKTLSEVEPRIAVNSVNTPGDGTTLFRISLPGSYYLTGNVDGVSGKRGIVISANGVTLDLNGFALNGVTGSLDGIASEATFISGCTVRNGTVRLWAGNGITFNVANASGNRIQNVTADGNVGGIVCGLSGVIERCVATGNTTGFLLGPNSVIRDSQVSSSNAGGTGIQASDDCRVIACVANGAVLGINTGNNCIVTDCTAQKNTTAGITAATRCTVTNCTANDNPGSGIVVTGNQGRYDGNTTIGNGNDGLSFVTATFGNLIVRNTSYSNSNFQFRIQGVTGAGVSGPTRNDCAPIMGTNTVVGDWLSTNTNPWSNFGR